MENSEQKKTVTPRPTAPDARARDRLTYLNEMENKPPIPPTKHRDANGTVTEHKPAVKATAEGHTVQPEVDGHKVEQAKPMPQTAAPKPKVTSETDVERMLHERVLNLLNVDIPAYALIGYATMHTDVVAKKERGTTAAEYIALSYSDQELLQLVRNFDTQYDNNPKVEAYILEYVSELWNVKNEDDLNKEKRNLVRSLPTHIIQMNCCEGYKLCYFIASQRSAQNQQEDISAALMTDPAIKEQVYTRLRAGMETGEPLDIATHNAGREVQPTANATPQDIKYNHEKTDVENMADKCGAASIERYEEKKRNGLLDTVAKVANFVPNVKQSIDDARRENMGEERYAEYKEEKRHKQEVKEQVKVAKAQGKGPRMSEGYGNNFMQDRMGASRFGGRFGRRGMVQDGYSMAGSYGRNPMVPKLILWAVAVIVAVIDGVCLKNVGFSFKWVMYMLSLAVSGLSMYNTAKQPKIYIGAIVLVASVALSIFATLM